MELIRYIHLNPLRAKLVRGLKELDKYPWTGHSAILGRRKNPLIAKVANEGTTSAGRRIAISQFLPETEKTKNPINPVNPACPVEFENHSTGVKNKSLAEKTIEDVLLHFGDKLAEALRRYRQYACAVKSISEYFTGSIV